MTFRQVLANIRWLSSAQNHWIIIRIFPLR